MSVCPPKTSPNTSKCPQSPHHIPKLDPSDRQKIDRNEFQHRVRFLSIFCRLSAPYLVSACRPRRPRTPQNDSKVPTTSPNSTPRTDRKSTETSSSTECGFCRFSVGYRPPIWCQLAAQDVPEHLKMIPRSPPHP